jgi:Zn-dependent protease
MLPVLAAGDFGNPLFWAVMVGWIMTVVLHEFAHGVVAYWGGDYTVRERGGLTLNPLQYIDPVNSLLLPAVFLALGAVPLPGGVTYIRRDLLRNRLWESGVSLAGPAMNVLLFCAGAIALHPAVGWVSADAAFDEWSPGQRVVATLTILQLFAAMLNLIPVPPLDGFGVISPFLRPETRVKLSTPPTSIVLLIFAFILVWSRPVQLKFHQGIAAAFGLFGYSGDRVEDMYRAFVTMLFGR